MFANIYTKFKIYIDSSNIFQLIYTHLYIRRDINNLSNIHKNRSQYFYSNQAEYAFDLFLKRKEDSIYVFNIIKYIFNFLCFNKKNYYLSFINSNSKKTILNLFKIFLIKIFSILFRRFKYYPNIQSLRNDEVFLKRLAGKSIVLSIYTSEQAHFRIFDSISDEFTQENHFSVLYFDTYKKNVFGMYSIGSLFTGNIEENINSNTFPIHFIVINPLLYLGIDDIVEFLNGEYSIYIKILKHPKVIHIPKFLLNTNFNSQSVFTVTSELKAKLKKNILEREGLDSEILDGRIENSIHIKRTIKKSPLISIIIPFRDNSKYTLQCVESIQSNTEYKNYEILLIDNDSSEKSTHSTCIYLAHKYQNVRIFNYPSVFNFSSINNFAAKKAKGEYLLLLNNDICIFRSDWLNELLQHAQRPSVGAVGSMLIYPDKTIQHSGVVMGLGGIAGHIGSGLKFNDCMRQGRLVLEQNVSAVTGACLMTKKSIWIKLKGMDENFPIAYNDVDYCLSLYNLGYKIIYNPYSILIHFESKSRGGDGKDINFFRFNSDMNRLIKKWGRDAINNDDCFSIHYTKFSPSLKIKRKNEERLRSFVYRNNLNFYENIKEF